VAVAAFLAAYSLSHADGTGVTVEGYYKANLLPFFGSFERFTEASYGDYMRERIQRVTRTTLRKELSALRQFRSWCAERGVKLPEIPSLPKYGHDGVRAKNARKQVATILTEREIKQILLAMPERSRRTGNFVRPFFIAYWETGLRPTSLLKLEAGVNYTKGSKSLFLGNSQDKAHFGRTIPLTDAARKALDRVVPKSGVGKLFTGIDKQTLRESLEAAMAKTKITKRVSVYDFKHSRATQLANSGAPLTGVMHLLGHRRISTTAGYVQGGEKAALEALACVQKKASRS
jgi:site-specific recombinase XerD